MVTNVSERKIFHHQGGGMNKMNRKILLFFLAALLGWFFLPSATAFAKWQPQLAIGLANDQDSAVIEIIQGKGKLVAAGSAGKEIKETKAGSRITFQYDNGKIIADGKAIEENEVQILPADPTQAEKMEIRYQGTTYHGGAKIQIKNHKLTIVNLVRIEDYVKASLPEEMPYDWPKEALKAQSIAVRTYALKNRDRHREDGYDLCNTTHCQLYRGIDGEKNATTEAAASTYGQVLEYEGRLINSLYHTDSGGCTANSEEVWGIGLPYLQAVKEKRQRTMPWTVKVSLSDFYDKTRKFGQIGVLRKIRLSKLEIGNETRDRTASGRVREVVFEGSAGQISMSGNDLRDIFGLKSTLFDMELQGEDIIFSGFGRGHGLGLSQWGAKEMAASGFGAQDILMHYYHDVQLVSLYRK